MPVWSEEEILGMEKEKENDIKLNEIMEKFKIIGGIPRRVFGSNSLKSYKWN